MSPERETTDSDAEMYITVINTQAFTEVYFVAVTLDEFCCTNELKISAKISTEIKVHQPLEKKSKFTDNV